jgi:hypothetical protein
MPRFGGAFLRFGETNPKVPARRLSRKARYFFPPSFFFTNIDLTLSNSSILAPFFFMMMLCCSTDNELFHAQ